MDDIALFESLAPTREALLDAIDIFLSSQNMKAAGLSAERAEELLRDLKQRRYRRVRALGALSILAPERALELLPLLVLLVLVLRHRRPPRRRLRWPT